MYDILRKIKISFFVVHCFFRYIISQLFYGIRIVIVDANTLFVNMVFSDEDKIFIINSSVEGI